MKKNYIFRGCTKVFKNLLERYYTQVQQGKNVDNFLMKRLREYSLLIKSQMGRIAFNKWVIAIVASLGLTSAKAQLFDAPVHNPFNLSYNPDIYLTIPNTIDLDNDGDFDLLVTSYEFDTLFNTISQFHYYENIGNDTAPNFSNPVINPFNLSITTSGIGSHTAGDLDGDGDLDILYGVENDSTNKKDLLFYENTGDALHPHFTNAILNPFGLIPPVAGTLVHPEFSDLDSDGDIDLLVGHFNLNSYNTEFYYYENKGTNLLPSFANPIIDPFGIKMSGNGYIPSTTDIDLDGDIDIFFTSVYDHLFWENTGSAQVPVFDTVNTNPFSLQTITPGVYFKPTFSDMDHDGDPDMLMSSGKDGFYYFKNIDPKTSILEPIEDKLFSVLEISRNIFSIYTKENNPSQLYVMDIKGQELIDRKISNTTKIDFSSFAEGMYFISILNKEGERQTHKVLVR